MGNNQEAAKCKREITDFNNCVNKALVDTCRKCLPNYIEDRKPSYLEQFEKSIRTRL
jgi:hypothetical protein